MRANQPLRLLADACTCAVGLIGAIAMLVALGHVSAGGGLARAGDPVLLLLLAGALDYLDGRLAMAAGGPTRRGRALDALADFTAFGLAPVIVVMTRAPRGLCGVAPGCLDSSPRAAAVAAVCLLFLLAAAFRLRRGLLHPWQRGDSFRGLPMPAAGITLLAAGGLGLTSTAASVPPTALAIPGLTPDTTPFQPAALRIAAAALDAGASGAPPEPSAAVFVAIAVVVSILAASNVVYPRLRWPRHFSTQAAWRSHASMPGVTAPRRQALLQLTVVTAGLACSVLSVAVAGHDPTLAGPAVLYLAWPFLTEARSRRRGTHEVGTTRPILDPS